jgi:hypothetical protein
MDEFLFISILTGLIIGLIPAAIASGKGKSFILWWAYGAALFIVALIHAIMMKPTEEYSLKHGMKRCPYCSELIKETATVCKFCGRQTDSINTKSI